MPPSWRGNLDLVQRDRIDGWAQDAQQSDQPIWLRILDGDTPIGEVLADVYRSDLQSAGIGQGCHAFCYHVPGGLNPDQRHLIHVQRADDGCALHGSPVVLEPALANTVARSTLPAPWQGHIDVVSRARIEGWAYDERSPDEPIALLILDNDSVIARVLANRYRSDLESAGMGNGRHAFAVFIPAGLSPLTRHVIQILGETDGCEMGGSPVTLESAAQFDAALEHTVSAAVSALVTADERERALSFLAKQTETLLQQHADAQASREARWIARQLERRWGKGTERALTGQALTGQALTGQAPGGAPVGRARALVIDDLAPMPDRDAGSNAILSHMRALQRLGFEVSFVAADELWSKQDARAVLEALDIECCRAPFYASVEEVLRRQTDCFELIYLHRASNAAKYLALARHFCPRARILYSVADLHHVRLARQAKIEQRPELLARSQRLRLTEFTAASLANAVITHSIAEAQSLRSAVTGCNVHVVPWAVPARPTSVAWSERRGIAFIGSFSHAPNLDAARYLIEQIMPRVWQQDASMQCLLVGSHMPESIKHLSSDQVVVLGQVPDLSTVYGRVRMTVAPLRFGAGVKGKVLDSLAAGLPCVMSPIAAEGIVLPSTLADLVCADIEAFATRILQQHSAEAQADASSAAGVRFITQCYAESMVVDALKAAVEGRRAPPALAAIEAQR